MSAHRNVKRTQRKHKQLPLFPRIKTREQLWKEEVARREKLAKLIENAKERDAREHAVEIARIIKECSFLGFEPSQILEIREQARKILRRVEKNKLSEEEAKRFISFIALYHWRIGK